MIVRPAATIAACFVLAVAPAAQALSVSLPSPRAPQTPAVEALGDWLSEIAQWGQGYERVLHSRGETLLWIISLAEELTAKIDSGAKTDLRSWTAQRAGQARGRLQADITAYRALPTEMPALDPRLPVSPEQREQVRNMALTADRVGAMLISTGQSSETFLTLFEAAGSGRSEDLMRLAAGLMAMSASQMEAENVMLAGNLGNPSSPQHHLTLSSIEANKAMMVWLNHRRAVVFDEPVQSAASAGAIRRHAAAVEQAANQMDAATDRLEQTMRGEQGAVGPMLSEKLSRLLADLHVAAGIEREIADALADLAAAVESGDLEAEDEVSLRIDPLIVRRIEADSGRRQLIAEMGG